MRVGGGLKEKIVAVMDLNPNGHALPCGGGGIHTHKTTRCAADRNPVI